MTVSQFLIRTNSDVKKSGRRPTALCVDGYKLSIQAGYGIYCETTTGALGNEVWMYGDWKEFPIGDGFQSVEVALLDEDVDLDDTHALFEYADCTGWQSPICNYLPVNVLDKFLESHGGIIDTNEEG